MKIVYRVLKLEIRNVIYTVEKRKDDTKTIQKFLAV